MNLKLRTWPAIASLIVGFIVLIVGLVLGWYVFPKIVEDAVNDNVVLYNDTEQYDRFKEIPIPLNFKVYIFNVKNAKDVIDGKAEPEYEEKGPYVYKQTRNKTDIEWDEEDRISYYEFQYFDYDQTESGELKETDKITVLNPALNGAIQLLQEAGLTFILKMLSNRIKETFYSDSIFLETTVGEFLFDGYKICDLEEIEKHPVLTPGEKVEATIVCLAIMAMPTKNIVVKKKDNGYGYCIFTFVGHKKDKHDGRYTIYSGVDDVQRTGNIEEWENKPYLSSWLGGNESSCNKVRGRDGVIFPPHLGEDSVITVFNTDICRTVDLHYSNDLEFRDVTALEYRLGREILRSPKADNADEMCYCLQVSPGILENSTGCLKDGMVELFTCYNAPILLSYPHFLWASEEYQDSVKNMAPNVEKHKTYALLEPVTGTPLQGAKRVQFNMFVNYEENINFLKAFEDNTKLIPIIWLEEGFTITDDLYDQLYDLYISKTYLIEYVKWSVIGIGCAILIITIAVVIVLKAINKRNSKETV